MQYTAIGRLAAAVAILIFVFYALRPTSVRPSAVEKLGNATLGALSSIAFVLVRASRPSPLVGALMRARAGRVLLRGSRLRVHVGDCPDQHSRGQRSSVRVALLHCHLCATMRAIAAAASAAWLRAELDAEPRRRSYTEALLICFRGGAFSALFVLVMCLCGVSLVYLVAYYAFAGTGQVPIADVPLLIVGYGFGASFVALFMQLGGGIYTKAADVGADLVGKVGKRARGLLLAHVHAPHVGGHLLTRLHGRGPPYVRRWSDPSPRMILATPP